MEVIVAVGVADGLMDDELVGDAVSVVEGEEVRVLEKVGVAVALDVGVKVVDCVGALEVDGDRELVAVPL